MSLLSPRTVLARVAQQVPEPWRPHLIVIGSLAAAYHLFREGSETLVRTKDIDCVLVPRVQALRAGKSVADALIGAGWKRRGDGPHADPGTAATPDDRLPVIRLHPPESTDWFVEFLSALDADDPRDRAFERVVLADGSHHAMAAFRHLEVTAYQPAATAEGISCARLSMLVLSNLLRNPTIRPDRMVAAVGPGPRRSNKDLGRVLTIARLAGRDAVGTWAAEWAEALRTLHGERWVEAARKAGSGIRALLASEGDVREALAISRTGLLAQTPMLDVEFRAVGERLLVDAIEELERATAS